MEIKVTKTAPVYDLIGLSEEELMVIRRALNIMVDINRMTFGVCLLLCAAKFDHQMPTAQPQ